jgi:gliding motility-associated-like protein
VNQTIYDESNPNGVEILTNVDGCDSVVMVELMYLPQSSDTIAYLGCFDDGYSIVVNGTLYDASHDTGTEVLANLGGCDSIVHVQLEFESCMGCAYYIPNVISVNGDGINDIFMIYHENACEVDRFNINIYNRWGALVYNSSDFDFNWDAHYKGAPLNPGVFVYVVEMYFDNQNDPVVIHGDVTLLH